MYFRSYAARILDRAPKWLTYQPRPPSWWAKAGDPRLCLPLTGNIADTDPNHRSGLALRRPDEVTASVRHSFWRPALNLVLLLTIGWVLLGYARYAAVAPPNFDGAMNLNTALSFVKGHGYGFFYNVFFPFPAQTDGPFTLPAGLLMRLAGVTPLATQGVSLAYLVGTVVAGLMLLRRLLRSFTVALAGMIILLTTPGLFPYSMGGIGEIPCLFWLFLSLLILASTLDTNSPPAARLLLGGSTLALCYLTKVIALLLVVPTLVLFTLIFVLRSHRHARNVIWLFLGLVSPIAAWEVFRLVEIGSVTGYLLWWHLQIEQAFQQSGAADIIPIDGLIAKLTQHLHILRDMLGTPQPALAVFLLVPWIVTFATVVRGWQSRDWGNVFCLSSFGSIAVLYFFWWLIMELTYMAWPRRIVDGVMVQQILLMGAVAALIQVGGPGGKLAILRRLLPLGLAVALTVTECFLIVTGETLTDPPTATAVDRDVLALANKVRDLPEDATLFGFGWWKAPVLALFSGRPMMNFQSWDPRAIDALPHKYLVLDFSAKSLHQDVQNILAAGTSHLVADGPGGAIYELDKVLPFAPFTAPDRDTRKLRSGFTIANGPYAAIRGFNSAQGDYAWVKPDAAVLLRRTVQTKLSLSIFVPSQLAAAHTGTPLQLHIISANCIDSTVPIESGMMTIILPLSCPPSAAPEAMEISLHANGQIPTVRQIDAGTARLAYEMSNMHLRKP